MNGPAKRKVIMMNRMKTDKRPMVFMIGDLANKVVRSESKKYMNDSEFPSKKIMIR